MSTNANQQVKPAVPAKAPEDNVQQSEADRLRIQQEETSKQQAADELVRKNACLALNASIVGAARDHNETGLRLWWLSQESKTQQSWKYHTMRDGTPCKGWKKFMADVLGDQLKNWARPARNGFIESLYDDNFDTGEIAEMTGISRDTVQRVLGSQNTGAEEVTAGGTPKATTETSKLVKRLESFRGVVSNPDKVNLADIRNAIGELRQTLVDAEKQEKILAADHAANRVHASTEGTTGNGVNAKPGDKRAA
jgi:transposase